MERTPLRLQLQRQVRALKASVVPGVCVPRSLVDVLAQGYVGVYSARVASATPLGRRATAPTSTVPTTSANREAL
jgi:hypothetical protein